MAARGMFFGEGPMACPFVALESDRDRRSDEPDHRHRCYAEPDPAPRALAHQREYCLAAAFTACPIFQDWAIRAAATPVPLRPGRMQDTERDENPAWAAPPPWVGGPTDSEAEAEGDDQPEPTDDQPEPTDERAAEQATDDSGGPSMAPSAGFVAPPARPSAEVERLPSADAPEDGGAPSRAAAPRPAEGVPQPDEREAAPLPGFLASRADDRPRPGEQPAQPPAESAARAHPPHETLSRDDVVPAWGRKSDYGQARSRVSLGDAGSVLSKLTTMLAVGAIIALAVVVIILAPSLLGFLDGGAPATTPPGGAASPTAGAPSPSPTVAPTPSPSPRTYTVQAGDTLFSIARRHGLTVEQLLAANPQVTNPNLVQIGQVLLIPEDDFGLLTPAPVPSPSPSP